MSLAGASMRSMTHEDMPLVRSWRNDWSVRQYMNSTHEISEEEHANWFAQASADQHCHLLIYEASQTPIGFVAVRVSESGGLGEWGFYKAPRSPCGTGRAMGLAALKFAFSEIGLYKLNGRVLAFNEKSVEFHAKLGFELEGTLRHDHFDGVEYHDVVCFGFFAKKWFARG